MTRARLPGMPRLPLSLEQRAHESQDLSLIETLSDAALNGKSTTRCWVERGRLDLDDPTPNTACLSAWDWLNQ